MPPGQYETHDFPVLSAGPTPRVDRDAWRVQVTTEGGERARWTWPQLMALPTERHRVDLHCVTKWSKFGIHWRGVSLDTLLEDVETAAEYALVHSYGGYTTNLPLEDLLDGQAWIAYGYDGDDARSRARRPGPAAGARTCTCGSRPSGCAASSCCSRTSPASGRALGYHNYGDPWREQRYQGD